MLVDAQREIERRIHLRLRQEAGRLPEKALASGQYLDHPDYDQRGLYGTAATMCVLARRATSDPAVAEQVSKLLYYVVNRSQAERAAVSGTLYRELVGRRIRLQRTDVFRMADIGFAVSFVTPAATGRTEALALVQKTLDGARLDPAGYAVGVEGGAANPLATAHALRCLAANNLPTRPEDWRYLREYLSDGSDVYVRCFVLLVLATYDPDRDRASLQSSWRECFTALRAEFHGHAEANHEYTRCGEQDYVRVPWQIYLVQACARLFPLTRFNGIVVQRKLCDIARQISGPAGFRYDASGSHLSTRTYACVWQAFSEVLDFNFGEPLPRLAVRAVSGVTRALSSRLFAVLTISLLAAVAVASLVQWLNAPGHSLGDLAPNLLAEVVLLIAARLGLQVRRARYRD